MIQKEVIPKPPFWGNRIVRNISPASLISYINRRALFNFHWELNGDVERGEKILQGLLRDQEEFYLWKMQLSGVYGFYACQSKGDHLIVYETPAAREEGYRFVFPRQQSGGKKAISDFFTSVQSGILDLVAFQVVTLGGRPTYFERQLYKANRYQDYFYWHGFFAALTDALAEFIHQRIRVELGFLSEEPMDLSRLPKQEYHGARFSFGYSSCPNLQDQEKVCEMLDTKRIGVAVTEALQLIPEHSTSAIIVHNSDAKQFAVL